MLTAAERLQTVYDLFNDPALKLTFRELVTFSYNAMGYEFALSARARATRRVNKHAARLNNDKAVFALRKQMANL